MNLAIHTDQEHVVHMRTRCAAAAADPTIAAVAPETWACNCVTIRGVTAGTTTIRVRPLDGGAETTITVTVTEPPAADSESESD